MKVLNQNSKNVGKLLCKRSNPYPSLYQGLEHPRFKKVKHSNITPLDMNNKNTTDDIHMTDPQSTSLEPDTPLLFAKKSSLNLENTLSMKSTDIEQNNFEEVVTNTDSEQQFQQQIQFPSQLQQQQSCSPQKNVQLKQFLSPFQDEEELLGTPQLKKVPRKNSVLSNEASTTVLDSQSEVEEDDYVLGTFSINSNKLHNQNHQQFNQKNQEFQLNNELSGRSNQGEGTQIQKQKISRFSKRFQSEDLADILEEEELKEKENVVLNKTNIFLSNNSSSESQSNNTNTISMYNQHQYQTIYDTDYEYAILEEAQELLHKLSAKIVKRPQTLTSQYCQFQCQCQFQHCWETNLSQLKQEIWCPKCENLLAKAQEYAKEFEGTLLSTTFEKKLLFKCAKEDHEEFVLSAKNIMNYKEDAERGQIFRKLNSKSCCNASNPWCSQCKKEKIKEEKNKYKQIFKEQEEERNQEYAKLQEEMFQKAKLRQKESEKKKQQQQSKVNENMQQKIQAQAKIVEKEVEKIAEKSAIEYFQSPEYDGQSTIEMINAVLKVLFYPEKVMKVYFSSLNLNTLKKEYHRLALSIHPDKNFHPQAATAFKKLHQQYSNATNNCKN